MNARVERGENAAVRGAVLSDPHEGVVGIIVSGFASLYPTYRLTS